MRMRQAPYKPLTGCVTTTRGLVQLLVPAACLLYFELHVCSFLVARASTPAPELKVPPAAQPAVPQLLPVTTTRPNSGHQRLAQEETLRTWSDVPTGAMSRLVMHAQHRLRGLFKPLLFRGRPRPRRIRFGPGKGVWLWLDRQHQLSVEFGLHEREVHGIYTRHVRAGSVVYDIGAFDGDTALPLGHLAPNVSVVAFEPDPALCRRIDRNLQLNPALASCIQTVNCYLGAADRQDRNGPAWRSVDSLLAKREIRAPDFVKIDVDGTELEVLQGMKKCLTDHRPVVLVEVHSVTLEQQCVAFLKGIGYGVEVVKNARWRAVLPEYRPIPHNRWVLADGA